VKAGIVMTVAAVVLQTGAASVSAHHSFAAEFDATKPITLEGVITKIELINPHGWIYMDVKGSDGRVQNWAVETGSAAALARGGIRRANLTAGTRIEVKGYRAKDGSPTINGNVITLPDGQGRSLGSSLGATP
jgi:hypothetical protein